MELDVKLPYEEIMTQSQTAWSLITLLQHLQLHNLIIVALFTLRFFNCLIVEWKLVSLSTGEKMKAKVKTDALVPFLFDCNAIETANNGKCIECSGFLILPLFLPINSEN